MCGCVSLGVWLSDCVCYHCHHLTFCNCLSWCEPAWLWTRFSCRFPHIPHHNYVLEKMQLIFILVEGAMFAFLSKCHTYITCVSTPPGIFASQHTQQHIKFIEPDWAHISGAFVSHCQWLLGWFWIWQRLQLNSVIIDFKHSYVNVWACVCVPGCLRVCCRCNFGNFNVIKNNIQKKIANDVQKMEVEVFKYLCNLWQLLEQS